MAPAWRFHHRRRLGRDDRARLPRQEYPKRRPIPRLAIDGDPAVVLVHDAVNGREAKSGAFAQFLCGEEWLEDARQHMRGDAGARIAGCQTGEATGTRLRHRGDGCGIELRPDDVRSLRRPARHGIARVHREVEQHLLDHAGVGQHHEIVERVADP